jgi:hypothetical protein
MEIMNPSSPTRVELTNQPEAFKIHCINRYPEQVQKYSTRIDFKDGGCFRVNVI